MYTYSKVLFISITLSLTYENSTSSHFLDKSKSTTLSMEQCVKNVFNHEQSYCIFICM